MAISLTEEDQHLIKKIGLRIVNKKIRVLIKDVKESYTNEFVLVVTPRIDVFTTMAIAVHEGAHHRFRSIIKSEMYDHISTEYPKIARVIYDAFEDFRVNLLNQEIYPGFVSRFRQFLIETKQFQNCWSKLENTINQVHQRLEFEKIFDDANTYPIWEIVDEQKKLVERYLSPSAILIAAKNVVDAILVHLKQEEFIDFDEIQFIPKTRTPNFHSNSLDDLIAQHIRKEFFSSLHDYKTNSLIEKRLEAERESILSMIENLKRLPESENPTYLQSNLKLECLSPEQYGCGESYDDVVYRQAPLIHKLRKEFQQIMLSPNPRRGGRRGKIMSRDLPRFVTSRGMFDRVFQIDENNYGANLMILVDESGSMTRRKLPIAREAIIAIMEALEGTKINTCVIGFAAKNSSLVISEKVYKEFNTPINRERLAAINTTEGFEYNRDGDSFELAAKHFSETNHLNSIMVVLSDGCPNHGCNYTNNEGRRLTNLSIRFLRNRGIELYALGIKIYTPITYSEMYDNKGVTFIDTYEIEPALIQLIRQIATELQIKK